MTTVEVEDLLDHPALVWQVLDGMNISALSYARMMNGLIDKSQHVDANHSEVVFKTTVYCIAQVLDGIFKTVEYEHFAARLRKIEHVYLDAADEPEPYKNTQTLLRRVIVTWREF